MITLSLPYPPTANNLFLNVGKRRVRTKRYDAWLADAAECLRLQRPQPIAGTYKLSVIAERPDRRARDLDNLLKPISDALKKHGVIEDDSKALALAARWSSDPPRKDARVTVFVVPV